MSCDSFLLEKTFCPARHISVTGGQNIREGHGWVPEQLLQGAVRLASVKQCRGNVVIRMGPARRSLKKRLRDIRVY